MALPRRSTHTAHLVDDVGKPPVHEQLVGRAEVGAPVQLEVGEGARELGAREVAVERDDDVAEGRVVLVGEATPRRDVEGHVDAAQRDAMARGEQLRCTDPGDDVMVEGDPALGIPLDERVDEPDRRLVVRRVTPHEEADRRLTGGQPVDDVGVGVHDPGVVCRVVESGVRLSSRVGDLDDAVGTVCRDEGVADRLPCGDEVGGHVTRIGDEEDVDRGEGPDWHRRSPARDHRDRPR